MYIRKYGKPIGALHGLPVSLKDVFNIKGVDTTMGFVGLLGNAKKISSESQIVRLLRRLGAVLYVKTSVPTGSFTGDTFNNIIQYTPNPCNRRLTVGGSSGGEGGLLALKGSPLGVGTDIGGSVRVPAVWNGCYGLRPSTGRIPSEGTASIVDGQMAIPFVLGFMAPSAEAITLATRSLLSLGPWMDDPLVHEIPWREDIYTKFKESASGRSRLSFGVMRTDHYVNVQPPVQRAMDIMVHRIRSLGHSVCSSLRCVIQFCMLINPRSLTGTLPVIKKLSHCGHVLWFTPWPFPTPLTLYTEEGRDHRWRQSLS